VFEGWFALFFFGFFLVWGWGGVVVFGDGKLGERGGGDVRSGEEMGKGKEERKDS
jgi:hypothetical protein